MSRFEWERGTIKLPAAEYAPLRKAMQTVLTDITQSAFEHTQTFWKGLTRKQQSNQHDYRVALFAWMQRMTPTDRRGYDLPMGDELSLACDLLTNHTNTDGKPARVLKSELDFPTNRTTDFVWDELSIGFNKKNNTVTWVVNENNRAVTDAHDSKLGGEFLRRINQVRWTRHTGGVLIGNDEYTSAPENASVGGGANYVTHAWGPVGALEAPERTDPWFDPKGQAFKVEHQYSKSGFPLAAKVVKATAAEVHRSASQGMGYAYGYGGAYLGGSLLGR